MRDAGLTFSLSCSLRDCQSALECPQRLYQIYLHQILSLLDVYLDQFLPYQSHHLCALILRIQSAGIIKCVLQYLDGLVSLLALVVTLAEAQQRYEFELFVLSSIGRTLQDEASSMTF